MNKKNRLWYYIIPVMGAAFCLWYLNTCFYDVVYSDYIRLVTSYLPDVWNPDKFFVPDMLTRVPANYLARIINTTFFHYSVRFDQVLGVLSLGASALILAYYCIGRDIGAAWFAALMIMMFSLNKWEMLNNGSGWVHFLAFVGFYYHYLVWDRVWTGQEKKGDHIRLLVLPWIVILGIAGPYCAVYEAVLLVGYGFCMVVRWLRSKVWEKRYLAYAGSSLVPFVMYLWSNAQVVPDWQGYSVAEGSIFQYLLDVPGYFVRFVLKSLSSIVVGQEAASQLFAGNGPYLVLGLLVAGAYLVALWYQFRYRLYEKTLMPMILIVSGAMNHLLILWSRWSFLREDYGMSSRYALQFQVGILGILLTFALMWRYGRSSNGDEKNAVGGNEDMKNAAAAVRRVLLAALTIMFLAGNGLTTWKELKTAPYRKEYCQKRAQIALDFENKTDDELRAAFEFRTSWSESGPMVRQALTILKENNWNVFHE